MKYSVYKSTAKSPYLLTRNLIKNWMKKYNNIKIGSEWIGFDLIEDEYDGEDISLIHFEWKKIDYYIQILDEIPIKNGCKMVYIVFEKYCCNDCDKEYLMDVENGWTRCEECASHY